MESNDNERNLAVTERADPEESHPPDDTSNNAIYRDNRQTRPVTERLLIDTELNNTKTQTSTMSTGEFANDTSKEDTTRLEINNSSVDNAECSSNPSPSHPITLPNSESPLPVITLTPVTQENFESNSLEYLHYYITYNPDGTITAYPIYPYDPESPAMDHQSERQLPAFRVNLASDPSASQVYQFQDSASVTQAFSQNNVPGSQVSLQNSVQVPEVFAQNNVQVSQSNETLWQTVDQSDAQGFKKNTQSSYTVFHGNQKSTPVHQDVCSNAPVYQDVCINTPVSEDDQSNVPVYQAVQSNDMVYQVAQMNDLIYQDVNSNAQVYQYDRSDTVHQQAQGNCAEYEGVQRNAPVYQVHSHAPLYQDVQSNATTYQDVPNNVPLYQDVQSSVPLYQDVQSNAAMYYAVQSSDAMYQDVQSNVPLYHDIQSNVPLYQNVQSSIQIYQDVPSNPSLNQDIQGNSTGQHDHNDGPEFEELPLPHFRQQQSKCDDSPSFTSWYGRHAAVESRLVAAVRTIALKNPNFIRLFQNRDKQFHRNNKPGAKADKVKVDNPVPEMPLLSSSMSTSLNAASYPRTSPQVETETTDIPISEVPLPIDFTLAKSSTQIQKLPEEKLTNSAEAFQINAHTSPNPLRANISKGTLSSAEPQLNSTQTQLNFPKSESLESGLSSNNTFTKIGIPKIQITDYDKPILSNEVKAVSRLKANVSPKDANAPEVKVAFIKPNTKKGLEQILFSKNCVTLNGPTAAVESGAARKTTPKKVKVPRAVLRTIYRHRDTVQKFIEQGPGSEGPRRPLILSLDKTEIQEITEQKPKEDATGVVALKTTPLTRKLRSKKKTANKSPAEKYIGKDVEPDVTG